MALAKYFSKDVLAISQVLNGGTIQLFEQILEANIVEVAFDHQALSNEGRMQLDLLIRLLSRLYPRIKITDLEGGRDLLTHQLEDLARNINTQIEITKEIPTITVVVGKTSIENLEDRPIFYIGSDGWLLHFSRSVPVGCGNSTFPFAPGIAACIASANVFKFVFNKFLPDVNIDTDFSFSLQSLNFESQNVPIELSDLDKLTLAGVGAIGNGFLWALSQLKDISGIVHIVDEQLISLSNLQRYVMTKESDEGRIKIELAAQFFEKSMIKIYPYARNWKNYCSHIGNQLPGLIIIALDSAKDRITVQASLPKAILNGFTEEGLLGISRHWNFLEEACLACVYLPSRVKQSRAMEVAQNLGLVNDEPTIRKYLYYNRDVDEALLKLVSDANGIKMEQLLSFVGTPMSEFYSNFVCGGMLLKLKGDSQMEQKIEAPLAFQSTFAGILLASELFLWKAGYRKETFATMTHFYPLLSMNPDSNPYHHTLKKDDSGRCLCSDEDFQVVYKNKWMNLK